MNLRHIDPRSTDWMDAMLEGESERKRKPEAEPGEQPAGGQGQPMESTPLRVGGKTGEPQSLGSPPGAVSISR
jgi:hypothetical protein